MSSLENEPRVVGKDHPARSAPSWTVPVVIVASVLGLAGLGLGVYAVTKQPAKVVGPKGSEGPQGTQGPEGPQGAEGKQGPRGELAATIVVRGPTKLSVPNPPTGAVVQAQTSCPAGQVLLSGGAQVTATGAVADRNVTLRSSFPLNATTWETVGLVTGPLGPDVTMSLSPYVMCGVSSANASSGTTTTTTTP
jgi:hypothetical protein